MTFKMLINQPEDINNEKWNFYEPCVDYLNDLYKLDEMSVMGLMVTTGTITQSYEKFRNQFCLDSKLTNDIIVVTSH